LCPECRVSNSLHLNARIQAATIITTNDIRQTNIGSRYAVAVMLVTPPYPNIAAMRQASLRNDGSTKKSLP
jgi:hypothetical protein